MDLQVPNVHAPREEVIKQDVFLHRCLLCGREERSDDKYGPACTGPSWTDEHPMEPMAFVGKVPRKLIIPGR
jgi:hypothetical protein